MKTLWFKRILFTLSGIISVGVGLLISSFFPVYPFVKFLVIFIASALVFFLVVLFLVLIASILMALFGVKDDFFEQ